MPAGVGYSSDECGLAGPARELLGRLEIERAAHDAAALARERLARLNERRRSCGMAVPRANGSVRLLDSGLFTIQRALEHCKESFVGRVAAPQPFEYRVPYPVAELLLA